MTTDEARARIINEPDFVNLPHFDFSLSKVLDKFPDGAPDVIVAKALMITEDDVSVQYEQIVRKLRRMMGVRRG
jgi:hypothetical protein